MGWAASYIEGLQEGETVEFRPSGHSMTGRVNHKDLVVVAPLEECEEIEKGDIVLCKVKGSEYLHLVKKIGADGRYLIVNNKGRENGWINSTAIFGKMIENKGQ